MLQKKKKIDACLKSVQKFNKLTGHLSPDLSK